MFLHSIISLRFEIALEITAVIIVGDFNAAKISIFENK